MEIGISQHSPSFSSTLLDSIYRSIDQAAAGDDDMAIYTSEATRSTNKRSHGAKTDEEVANLRRACLIEKWMEKKAFEKSVVRRNSDQIPRKSENSSWSSSDSAAGSGGGGFGFFSPSDAESFPLPRPRPVRTSDVKLGQNRRPGEPDPKPKARGEGGFLRTKSRALKIYGDLKKVKQPISPGGKLAGFLNSLFPGSAAKTTKAAGGVGDHSTNASSTCSSASSFSRSCLSKTPSSRGKASSNGVKRSVRFSPVSVIVGEDSHPQKNKLHPSSSKPGGADAKSIRNVINEELMMGKKNRRVVEEVIARDYMLRNYHMEKKSHVQNPSFDDDDDYEDDDEDDDAASYASSDLFELDNLSEIGGMDHLRYREELPVYETTRLDRTNRPVVNGGGMVF